MHWEFDNERPIYRQLVEQLKIAIITNEYPPGERIPSVRDLSLEVKANPNTIQKALVELEQLGLIVTERTNGKFVTTDAKKIQAVRKELAMEMVNEFTRKMKRIQLSKEEWMEYMKKGGKKDA